MQGHPRTGAEIQPQRPHRLDAVEINHLIPGQDPEIAGLAHLFRQRLQDGVPGATLGKGAQHLQRQLNQPLPFDKPARAGLASEKSLFLEHLGDTVPGGLG